MDIEQKLSHDWYPKLLPSNVKIGERSWLYSAFAFLHYSSLKPCGVRIGHDSGLYNGTFFDLGPDGEVQIGDYCALVGAIICSNQRVVIEDYVFIAHEVVIADSFTSALSWENAALSNTHSTKTSPAVIIREAAWIGACTTILAGSRIGKGAIIGAGSVICSDVPDYTIVAGNPSRIVGRVKV